LALITLGEGWHNNHHYFMGSTRQGFYWWEIDISYYVIKVLSWLRLVWDVKAPPARVYDPANMLPKQKAASATERAVAPAVAVTSVLPPAA
jgi:stearoyl-CoA desaturase (delta-9 desaturase)